MVGPGDLALMLPAYNGLGVDVLDLRTGQCRFRLTPDSASSFVRTTQSGHFDGVPSDPLTASGVRDDAAASVGRHDPKRVGAALKSIFVRGHAKHP